MACAPCCTCCPSARLIWGQQQVGRFVNLATACLRVCRDCKSQNIPVFEPFTSACQLAMPMSAKATTLELAMWVSACARACQLAMRVRAKVTILKLAMRVGAKATT
eukprot:scaffold20395_cov16-Tisochrysis_lutea.AAC.1